MRISAILVALLCLLSPAGWAVEPGEPAPGFTLPGAIGGDVSLQSLLGESPVVVWFPDLDGAVDRSLETLWTTVKENSGRLVVIPTVGPDLGAAQVLAQRNPGLVVAHDADGRVTQQYCGEFLAGVAPSRNLYIISPGGRVSSVRFYPGLSPRKLSNLLIQAR